MLEQLKTIYQTGEPIPISGTFVVVGINLTQGTPVNEQAVCTLNKGDVFATYDGLEVCWHQIPSAEPLVSEPLPVDGHLEY